MREIDLFVEKEYIKGGDAAIGAAGSGKDVVLHIRFSCEWWGKALSAQWKNARGQASELQLLKPLDDGTVLLPVPFEAKRYAGTCMLTLKGTELSENGEAVQSACLSAVCSFKVLESLWDGETEQEGDPIPTVAEQLRQETDEKILEAIAAHDGDMQAHAELPQGKIEGHESDENAHKELFDGKVNRTGDTMTGDLILQQGNLRITNFGGKPSPKLTLSAGETMSTTLNLYAESENLLRVENDDGDPIVLRGIEVPQEPCDAANKDYVDKETVKCFPAAGGEVKGDVNVSGGLIVRNADGNGLSVKGYKTSSTKGAVVRVLTDETTSNGAEIANLRATSVLFTVPLSMYNKQIKNLGQPTAANDAATKAYVDNYHDDSKLTVYSNGSVNVSRINPLETVSNKVTIGENNKIILSPDKIEITNDKEVPAGMTISNAGHVSIGAPNSVSVTTPNFDLDARNISLNTEGSVNFISRFDMTQSFENLTENIHDTKSVNAERINIVLNTERSGIGSNLNIKGTEYESSSEKYPVDIQLNGSYVHDLADPTLPQDPATKSYVDAAIAELRMELGL